MRSQCMCVRTYVSVSHAQEYQFEFFRTHVHAQELMRHVHAVVDDNGGSRTERIARLVILNIRVLQSRVLNAADGWRH